MTESDRIPTIVLPQPNEGIVGMLWPVDSIATFRCMPGKVETIKGVKIKYPPTWERVTGDSKEE